MIYTNNSGILILVCTWAQMLELAARRKDHDIAMVSFGIDRILSPPYVICHVVDVQYIMEIHRVTLEVYGLDLREGLGRVALGVCL